MKSVWQREIERAAESSPITDRTHNVRVRRAAGSVRHNAGVRQFAPLSFISTLNSEKRMEDDSGYWRGYRYGYMAGRRSTWLEQNGPCRHCGSWERLEVDHVDPAQKVTHRVWSLTREVREAELAKCQVLCFRCHRAKHAAETRKPLVHGTINAYRKHRCRCEKCRAVNTMAEAARRRLREGAYYDGP